MLDTDTLLQPMKKTDDQVTALMALVRANTAAFEQIKIDLPSCDNADKVFAVLGKVNKAIEDLSMDSKKVDAWIKEPRRNPGDPAIPYGQYPVSAPINPHNPVPWPPGYTPPAPHSVVAEAEGEVTGPEKKATATGGKK